MVLPLGVLPRRQLSTDKPQFTQAGIFPLEVAIHLYVSFGLQVLLATSQEQVVVFNL